MKMLRKYLMSVHSLWSGQCSAIFNIKKQIVRNSQPSTTTTNTEIKLKQDNSIQSNNNSKTSTFQCQQENPQTQFQTENKQFIRLVEDNNQQQVKKLEHYCIEQGSQYINTKYSDKQKHIQQQNVNPITVKEQFKMAKITQVMCQMMLDFRHQINNQSKNKKTIKGIVCQNYSTIQFIQKCKQYMNNKSSQKLNFGLSHYKKRLFSLKYELDNYLKAYESYKQKYQQQILPISSNILFAIKAEMYIHYKYLLSIQQQKPVNKIKAVQNVDINQQKRGYYQQINIKSCHVFSFQKDKQFKKQISRTISTLLQRYQTPTFQSKEADLIKTVNIREMLCIKFPQNLAQLFQTEANIIIKDLQRIRQYRLGQYRQHADILIVESIQQFLKKIELHRYLNDYLDRIFTEIQDAIIQCVKQVLFKFQQVFQSKQMIKKEFKPFFKWFLHFVTKIKQTKLLKKSRCRCNIDWIDTIIVKNLHDNFKNSLSLQILNLEQIRTSKNIFGIKNIELSLQKLMKIKNQIRTIVSKCQYLYQNIQVCYFYKHKQIKQFNIRQSILTFMASIYQNKNNLHQKVMSFVRKNQILSTPIIDLMIIQQVQQVQQAQRSKATSKLFEFANLDQNYHKKLKLHNNSIDEFNESIREKCGMVLNYKQQQQIYYQQIQQHKLFLNNQIHITNIIIYHQNLINLIQKLQIDVLQTKFLQQDLSNRKAITNIIGKQQQNYKNLTFKLISLTQFPIVKKQLQLFIWECEIIKEFIKNIQEYQLSKEQQTLFEQYLQKTDFNNNFPVFTGSIQNLLQKNQPQLKKWIAELKSKQYIKNWFPSTFDYYIMLEQLQNIKIKAQYLVKINKNAGIFNQENKNHIQQLLVKINDYINVMLDCWTQSLNIDKCNIYQDLQETILKQHFNQKFFNKYSEKSKYYRKCLSIFFQKASSKKQQFIQELLQKCQKVMNLRDLAETWRIGRCRSFAS